MALCVGSLWCPHIPLQHWGGDREGAAVLEFHTQRSGPCTAGPCDNLTLTQAKRNYKMGQQCHVEGF